jgi:hypothetical protein
MKNRLLLLSAGVLMLLMSAVWLVNAQADTGPTLVNTAVRELNRSFPGIGESDSFTYTFSAPTNDSSLGCPLIEGFELPQSVVPIESPCIRHDTICVSCFWRWNDCVPLRP